MEMENQIVPGDIEILPMERKWLDDARRIYQWYVDNSTATFQIGPSSVAEMESLLFFPSARYGSFAALSGGEVVGYGIVTQFKKREAYDSTAEITIYLDHRFTGRGLGKKMAGYLEGFAREKGFHSLIAIVSGENTASCALFSRLGYAECARYHEVGRKFDRWLDVVCFELILR